MKEVDVIERAAEIHWGQYLDTQDVNLQNKELYLQTSETPESLLIEKDRFWKLPEQCRLVAEIILNLPEEMYMSNGKIKKMEVCKATKEKLGWDYLKTTSIMAKLSKCLGD